MRQCLRLSFVVFLLFISLTANGKSQENVRVTRIVQTFQPDGVDELIPCCDNNGTFAAEDLQKPRFIEHIQGKIVDDETYRKIKERAITEKSVPKPNMFLAEEEFPEPLLPASGFKFKGSGFNDQPDRFKFFPPDTEIAVGPNNILISVNVLVRLSTKSNSNVQLMSLGQFFSRPTGGLFDPRVYFDPLSRRFFIVVAEVNFAAKKSAVYLAVSQNDSPSSLSTGWSKFKIKTAFKGTWADFPTIGMNGHWVSIGTNQFRFSDFSGVSAQMRVISKQSLVKTAAAADAAALAKIKVFKFTRTDAFTIQAAHHASDDSTLFAASTFGVPSAPVDIYDFFQITGTTTPSLSKVQIRTGDLYFAPPNALHPHGKALLNTGDSRTQRVVFRDGKLYVLHSTACGSSPNVSCLRLAIFDPTQFGSVSSPLLNSITLTAGKNKFLWNGAMAVNEKGNAILSSQFSSKKVALSTAFAGMKTGATKLDASKILTKGNCPLFDVGSIDSRDRTGDYTGAALDPSDNTVWIGGEIAEKNGTRCEWRTIFGQITYK